VLAPQTPHTLFITCADSRIDPIELTSSRLGELFIVRNVGNVVGEYGDLQSSAAGAAIEYAICQLKVKHIVVCGHLDCGAIKALLSPDGLSEMPSLERWLADTHSTLGAASEFYSNRSGNDSNLMKVLVEQNVMVQLRHLKAHPLVAKAMSEKQLTISGWVYDIGAGRVQMPGYEAYLEDVSEAPLVTEGSE
jgi:carbonic anhydrase